MSSSSLMESLCDGASGDKTLEHRVLRVMIENFTLWKERHAKYGRGNISDFGALGCLVRSADKTARLKRFYVEQGGDTFSDESVADSWRDLTNYAVMGLMCHLGQWPGVESPQGEQGGEQLLTKPIHDPSKGWAGFSITGATPHE